MINAAVTWIGQQGRVLIAAYGACLAILAYDLVAWLTIAPGVPIAVHDLAAIFLGLIIVDRMHARRLRTYMLGWRNGWNAGRAAELEAVRHRPAPAMAAGAEDSGVGAIPRVRITATGDIPAVYDIAAARAAVNSATRTNGRIYTGGRHSRD